MVVAMVLPAFTSGAERGNPVRIRGCPAAVNENELHLHALVGEPAGKRWTVGRHVSRVDMLVSPNTCLRRMPEHIGVRST